MSVYLVLLVRRHQGTGVRGHLVRFSYPSTSLTLPHHGPGQLLDNTFLCFDTIDTFASVCHKNYEKV